MVQVGDKIRVLKDRANLADVKKGDEFIVNCVHADGGVNIKGSPSWAFGSENFEVVGSATPFKDPIEYLKSAHADGDMIDPATMLRECYGITKTERVVMEWSEAKREIKVGDKVRIIGPASYTDQSAFMGDVWVVSRVDIADKASTYYLGKPSGFKYWFPASSVELI